ncbi:hypothetical protein Tco_0735852 [Tanacetum coccineum]
MSERRNHTLLDMVRSMMNLITLLLSFWGYDLESAKRILNMVPTKKVLVKRDTPDKLQQRSVKCIIVGYPKETMGYYFYFPPENKIVVARKSPSKNSSEIPMEVEEVEEYSLRDLNEPTNYKAALLDPESDKWVDSMNAEMQSMKDNQFWCLIDLPPNDRDTSCFDGGRSQNWKMLPDAKVLLQCPTYKLKYIAAWRSYLEAVWIMKFISGLGEINLLKVHTDNNLADPFMKALPKGKLTQRARSMRLRLASSFM